MGEQAEAGAPVSVPAPGPAPVAASANAPSTSPPAIRPLYIPQFTAATQLILKRMKGEPSSLSSALSSVSASVTGKIKQSTYEDVKRRLVMGMNTSASMTVQMPTAPSPSPTPTPTPTPTPAPSTLATPAPPPRPGPPAVAKPTVSAIRRISSGLTGSGKVPTQKAPATKTNPMENKVKKPKSAAALKPNNGKRKRGKAPGDEGGDSGPSGFSDLSDFIEEPAASDSAPTPPFAVTKSGRQVQKPLTYNPAAMDVTTRKRTHYGKRTPEQALCKRCTRMHSPATNQMVFCDGCNDGWHQMCHDPWIDDAVVRDMNRSWYCATCVEKRAPHIAKRQKLEPKPPVPAGPPPKESWASKTPQQRRAYLLTLSNQELVGMIVASLEIHPDLPIFPSAAELSGAGPSQAAGAPRSLFAGSTVEGLFPRADANPTGQINFVRKIADGSAGGRSSSSSSSKGRGGTSNGGKHRLEAEDSQVKVEDDGGEEYDPLAALWPKPGKGLYSRLPPDTEDAEHMVDDDDYEAFSVIVYDERGRKIEENGMKV